MAAPENVYWSIEACAWVRSLRTDAEVPVQRPAVEEADEVVDLDAADLPSGVPI